VLRNSKISLDSNFVFYQNFVLIGGNSKKYFFKDPYIKCYSTNNPYCLKKDNFQSNSRIIFLKRLAMPVDNYTIPITNTANLKDTALYHNSGGRLPLRLPRVLIKACFKTNFRI